MKDWGATYQLVPPNVHRRNIAERAIRTFKARFLAILAGVHPDLPKYTWENLLVQTELTIILLLQATLTQEWQHGNISMEHLIIVQHHWEPLAVKS